MLKIRTKQLHKKLFIAVRHNITMLISTDGFAAERACFYSGCAGIVSMPISVLGIAVTPKAFFADTGSGFVVIFVVMS